MKKQRTLNKKPIAWILALAMMLTLIQQMGEVSIANAREVIGTQLTNGKEIYNEQKERVVYLSDMEWLQATAGSSKPNPTLDGNYNPNQGLTGDDAKISLGVDGTRTYYDKGIGTHAESIISYEIGGMNAKRFYAVVGPEYYNFAKDGGNEAQDEPGDIKFQVFFDDNTEPANIDTKDIVFSLTGTTSGVINLDIPEGTRKITLKVVDGGLNPWNDWGNWSEAQIICSYPELENLALGKVVVAKNFSDNENTRVNPDRPVKMVVDGVKNNTAANYCDFGDVSTSNPNEIISSYVQIDLQGQYELSTINLWRYWADARTYNGTVIAVSSDRSKANSTWTNEDCVVVYNSDSENRYNLGVGSDELYAETSSGMSLDLTERFPNETIEGRYIRIYMSGHANGQTNHIVELEALGYDFNNVKPIDVIIEQKDSTLKVGQTRQLTSTVIPKNSTNNTVTWASSDESIVVVDENGAITAISEGSATITATTENGLIDTATVTVIGTVPMRRLINDENPMFFHHLYKLSNTSLPGPLEGGNSIQGFWNEIKKLPQSIQDHQVILLHSGGYIQGEEDTLAWYEKAMQETVEDNIPFMLMVSNSGTYKVIPNAWLEEQFQKYPNFQGVVYSENHNGPTRGEDMADKIELVAKYGGYVVFSDMNDNGTFVERTFNERRFYDTAKNYKENVIIIGKTTSAWERVGYNSFESVTMGAWMADLSDNWGSLIDSWMWFIEGYGPLYQERWPEYTNHGPEECRGPFAFPELIFPMRMIQESLSGATVFSFEHPFHTTSIGTDNGENVLLTPNFTNAMVKAMEHIINSDIPTKEEVIEKTNVAYASDKGTLSQLAGRGVYLINKLYGDKQADGDEDTMLTHTTGRYGIIPSLPKYATEEDKAKFDIVIDADYAVNNLKGKNGAETKEKVVNFFNQYYPETYTGDGYVGKDGDISFAYNSSWKRGNDQTVQLPLGISNVESADITFEPYTYVVLREEENKINVNFNNYLVDKSDIWEGYIPSGPNATPHWDSDNNKMFYDYILNEYIPADKTKDNDFRKSTIVLNGLAAEPKITNVTGLENQYDEIVGVWDENTGEYTININANGYIDFEILIEDNEPTDIIVSKVNNLRIAEKTADSVTLSWEAPKTTVGLVAYVIYKDGKVVAEVDTNLSEHVVEELRANTIYGFKVASKYSNGEISKPQSVNVRTMKK